MPQDDRVLTERVPKARSARLFFMTVIGRAYPRIIALKREKSWLAFDILLPLIGVAAYVFVYRALHAPEAYIGFVILGGAMTAFWLNVLWGMSSQLYWERESGNLVLYIMAPAPMMAILLGMALGGMTATTLRAGVILVLGSLLFGVKLSVQAWLPLLAVFLLSLAALYGMGMMFASLFLLFGREAWHWVNLLQEPVYLLSGFYFPVRSLAYWVAVLASLIPLTLGLDAMRQLVIPDGARYGFLPVSVEVAGLAVLSVVFIATAKFLLDYLERLAKQEARLTESRK